MIQPRRRGWLDGAKQILVAALGLVAIESFGSTPPDIGPEVRKFVFHPTNPNIVYAATRAGVFISTNQGARWDRPSGSPRGVVWSLVMHPGNPDILFAGVEGTSAGIHHSRDAGKTWRALEPFVGRSVWALAIDPRGSELMFAVANYNNFGKGGKRLYRSMGAASGWMDVLDGHEIGVGAVAVAADGMVYVGTNGVVLRSADRGQTWVASSDVLPGRSTFVENLVADPKQPQVLYAKSSYGPIESNDGGKTWVLGAPGCWQYRQAADASVLFELCAVPGTGRTSAGPNVYLRKSSDAGRTWARADPGLPAGWFAIDVASHPADPKIVFASWANGGVYKSADGGQTWKAACIGITWRDVPDQPWLDQVHDCVTGLAP